MEILEMWWGKKMLGQKYRNLAGNRSLSQATLYDFAD